MFKSLLLAGVLVMAAPESLRYQPNSGEKMPIQEEFTYELTVSGPPGLAGQLQASNAALSIQHLRATRKGQRMFAFSEDGTSHVSVVADSAHVEGKTKDNPFQFDFNSPDMPSDLAQDPIRQFSWGFSMAPRKYTLGAKGEYHLETNNQDGQAEPMAIILNAPVGLPDHPVNVGDEWKSEWAGMRWKKDGGAVHFQQTAKLVEIIAAEPRLARITFSTSGRLDIPAEKNAQGGEVTLDATGSILLDLKAGLVVRSESAGTITTNLTKAGLKMVHTITSKYGAP